MPTPFGVQFGEISSTAIDVIDNQDEFWVYADLAGFTAENIQLRGDENVLMLAAERFSELEEGRSRVVQERPARIERTVQLPATVRIDSADAVLEDGVCKITLPKAATDRYTEIEVRSG